MKCLDRHVATTVLFRWARPWARPWILVEGAQQLSCGKGHFFLWGKFKFVQEDPWPAQGTTAKAQGTTTIHRSIRLCARCTCEQEHVILSNATTAQLCLGAKHTRTHVGPYSVRLLVVQCLVNQSIRNRAGLNGSVYCCWWVLLVILKPDGGHTANDIIFQFLQMSLRWALWV